MTSPVTASPVTASPVRVVVRGGDPVSEAGVASQLRCYHDLEVLPSGSSAADVVVVVADPVDADVAQQIRTIAAGGATRVVLVATAVDGGAVLAAVEAGVAAIVRRGEATPERLLTAIRAAATGDGHLPPDLLGRLLHQVGGRVPRSVPTAGLTFGGLTQRELTVLRLLADGCSTREIARQLAYSERTIKNAIHDLVTRFQLRNRTHAVAFAVRQGLI
ncbi:MAG: response regulator transcription factor [Actinobacteria bacterium]|nr:response regulator transcription factor [Actinomycetota bacterium]MBI3685967.1 response regulator transcription factor [Actinomycetota bacterium]